MPDEIIDTPQGEPGTPDPGAGSPPAGDSPTPPGTVTPAGDSPGGATTQPLETPDNRPAPDPIAESLKGLSAEELTAAVERGEKFAKTLSLWRPVIEGNQAQSDKLKPWESVVDRFQDPTKLNTQLELASEFLKDKVLEDGRTVPDTTGLPAYLDANSPTRADSLLVDLLQSKVAYNGVEDSRLNHVCRQMFGRDYQGVVAGLKELETRPAVSQVIDKAELEAIDPKFHDIWKTIAPETKEWLMDDRTSETARNDYLSRALSDAQRAESDRQNEERTTRERQENETKFFNEAKAEGEKAVDEGLGVILNSILDSTFKDISNDTVTLTGSKEDDVLMRLFIGGTLTSLTDPVKAPYVASDLKALGITLDPEIYQHEATYEKAMIAAKVATKYGDKMSADARQLEADNAQMWLKAKGNELASQMVERLSRILGISNEDNRARIAAANAGRAHIQGNPLTPGGNGNHPKFTKPLGPERTAEIVDRFAR